MGLPFTYKRLQRQPLDERLPDGRSVDEAVAGYPTVQPYGMAEAEPDPGWGQQPSAPAQSPPAVDPAVVQGAFPQPIVPQEPTESVTPDIPETPPQQPEPTTSRLAAMPTPPVMIQGDKYNRPDEAIGGADDASRNQVLLNSVRQYQPQKAHGWRRYLGPILAGWAAGQKGSRSPFAGLGGAIVGGLSGQFQPKQDDERWQKRKEEEVQSNINDDLEQQKAQAQVADIQSRSAARTTTATARANHEKYVQSNAAIQNILREYNALKGDYDPADPDEVSNPTSLTQRAAKLGMTLQPKNRALRGGFTFDGKRWEYGEDGKPKPLTDESGNVVVDPYAQSRIDNIKDQIRHRKEMEQQGATRIKQNWARIDISKQNAGAQGQFKTRFNQARQAVNRFNDLTRRAAQAASWGDAQAKTNSAALIQERDQLEQQIKDQYGDYITLDDKGKPSQLRRMWSLSQFKQANPKSNVKAAQSQAESDGAIIVP